MENNNTDEITEFKITGKIKQHKGGQQWLLQGKYKHRTAFLSIFLTDDFAENYSDIDEFCKEQFLDWCKENPFKHYDENKDNK